MSPLLYIRLSAMMFLQYAIWAFWLPVFARFLGPADSGGIGLDADQTSWMFTVYGLGALIGPFTIGYLADRKVSSERLMALCHIMGGALLMAAAYTTRFEVLFGLMVSYCTLYMPTMGLTQSISFQAIGAKGNDYFAYVRLWGTIGWIVTSIAFGYFVGLGVGDEPFLKVADYPWLVSLFGTIGEPSWRDCLRLPAVLSWVYGLYCLTLPHTPPSLETATAEKGGQISEGARRGTLVQTLSLMGNRSFATLTIVTALVGVMLAFYFALENQFLVALGVPEERAGQLMAIGQGAELFLMFLVPVAVLTLGIKWTMILGATAWITRFGISAMADPSWMETEWSFTWTLIIGTIGLHGFAFGFFFVPAFMYVDRSAPHDIRASAQNYLILLVYGIGTVVGSKITGPMVETFVDSEGNIDWTYIWGLPTIVTAVAVLAFLVLFRDTSHKSAKSLLDDPVVTKEEPAGAPV